LQTALGLPLLDTSGNLLRIPLNSAQYQTAIDALLLEQKAVEQGLFESITRRLESTTA
jgi:hypothetical protein